MNTLFTKKGVDNFETEHKNANFGVGGAVTPDILENSLMTKGISNVK